MRKTWLIIGLLGVMVLIGGCTGPGTTAQPTPAQPGQTQPSVTSAAVQVDIKDFTFVPGTITVSKGTTVIWTNRDSAPHTVTSDTFDSGTLNQGQTFTYTFNQAGTFEYRCTIHPSIPHGNVIVT
ncbi:MAG: cupredoxin domain-containing protein [Candidatus Methanoperedens sp.]|nr:cupredoxin domain-containing protein [Candidatus Methanoperedens sp.]